MVKDAWLADDITQETFVRAMRHIDGLKDPDKLTSWLFQVAHNLCRDHFRTSARQATDPLEDEGDIPSDAQPGVDTQLERHQMNACVQHQMEKLTETHRSVLWLFDVLGFSLKEIADILDISLANVKVRLHRARRQLREILTENCQFSKDGRDVLVCVPRE